MGLSQAKMAQRLIKLHLPQWQSSLAVGAGLLCLSVYSSLITDGGRPFLAYLTLTAGQVCIVPSNHPPTTWR